jgi:NAD(P)-dependent dehydrogenase (short-subunit alcohol dehydrogenase family)
VFDPGKVAVVTGVGPGMGRSIVRRFAESGVDVVMGARRVERLEAIAQEVREFGREPLVVPVDLADRAACRQLVDAAVERFGGVDYLVQNGHHEGDWVPVADADADSWRAIMDVNFFGALHLVQAVAPLMERRGGGSIVLVNSGAAVRFPVNMGAYSASKAAMASLVRTAALELGPRRIRVNGVYLGPVDGDTMRGWGSSVVADAGGSLAEWLEAKAREIPLGSIPTPDECAGSVLFFCSDLAAPVTGQHLAVNGGQWTS